MIRPTIEERIAAQRAQEEYWQEKEARRASSGEVPGWVWWALRAGVLITAVAGAKARGLW